MQIRYAGFTMEQVLPLILAILLIFLLPMIMRRNGWDFDDFMRALVGGLWKKGKYDPKAKEKAAAKKREPANLKKLMMKALLKRAFGINYFFYGHEKQLILQIREI